MNFYYYVDFSIKLKNDTSEEIEAVFVKGAVIKSLNTIFGEIGALTEVDLLKFDEERKRGIIRISSDFAFKLRTALTLIQEFQGTPAIFQVNKATNQLASIIETFIEF